MFDWLFEGRLTVYLVLAVAALILLGLWTRDRRRGWLGAVAGVAVLIGLVALLDWLVETRREQIERKLQEMARAVPKKDAEAIFRHLARDFRASGMERTTFRSYVERALRDGLVSDLQIWGPQFPDETGKVTFFAKPESSYTRGEYFLIRAEFTREGEKEWRLKGFQIFNPFVDTNKPLEIPAALR